MTTSAPASLAHPPRGAGRRPHRPLCLLVLGCAALAGCRPAGAGAPTGDWVPFTSMTAAFSASYPSTPNDKLTADGKGHLYALEYDRGRRYLSVSYRPDVDAGVPLANRFEAARNRLRATVTATSEVVLDGRRGTQASYEYVQDDGKTYTQRHAMFYSGGALYQIQGAVSKGSGGEADVERFFAGFHFLPAAADKP